MFDEVITVDEVKQISFEIQPVQYGPSVWNDITTSSDHVPATPTCFLA